MTSNDLGKKWFFGLVFKKKYKLQNDDVVFPFVLWPDDEGVNKEREGSPYYSHFSLNSPTTPPPLPSTS